MSSDRLSLDIVKLWYPSVLFFFIPLFKVQFDIYIFIFTSESGSEGDQICHDLSALDQPSHCGSVFCWSTRIQQTVRRRWWISTGYVKKSFIFSSPNISCAFVTRSWVPDVAVVCFQVGPVFSWVWFPSCFSLTCVSTGFTASYTTSLYTRWVRPESILHLCFHHHVTLNEIWLETCLIYKFFHLIFWQFFHKPHHIWKIPTPFASHAFHPVDGFLQGLPYHIYPFFFPLHKVLYLGLYVFVNIWTISIHDGDYRVPSSLISVINGSAHHTDHHLFFDYNYGQYFTLWDRLGGSYRHPSALMGKGPHNLIRKLQAEGKLGDNGGKTKGSVMLKEE